MSATIIKKKKKKLIGIMTKKIIVDTRICEDRNLRNFKNKFFSSFTKLITLTFS